MRLNDLERNAIIRTIAAFDPKAQVLRYSFEKCTRIGLKGEYTLSLQVIKR